MIGYEIIKTKHFFFLRNIYEKTVYDLFLYFSRELLMYSSYTPLTVS